MTLFIFSQKSGIVTQFHMEIDMYREKNGNFLAKKSNFHDTVSSVDPHKHPLASIARTCGMEHTAPLGLPTTSLCAKERPTYRALGQKWSIVSLGRID